MVTAHVGLREALVDIMPITELNGINQFHEEGCCTRAVPAPGTRKYMHLKFLVEKASEPILVSSFTFSLFCL
jgi:hypothetical protein